MPYVDKQTREYIDRWLFGDSPATTIPAETPGELNYLITTIIEEYRAAGTTNYETLNDIVGVLECAKLELYRRVAAPYEDEKCALNGDVYSPVKPD